MAIERKNKFDNAVKALEEKENLAQERADKVITKIAGEQTKTVVDKTGRVRELKVKEKRKAFQVYLPESLYEKLDEVVADRGRTRNSIVEELIRDFLGMGKKDID